MLLQMHCQSCGCDRAAGCYGCYGSDGAAGTTGSNGSHRCAGCCRTGRAAGRPGFARATGAYGSDRSTGCYGSDGAQGQQGPTVRFLDSQGATGATRPQGTVPDDSFASFINYQMQLMPDSLIVLFPDITDSTGNIASADLTHIRLEPGCYLISYEVSVVFNSANYMQVTPSYNGAPHLETSIYFATRTDGSSACGSSFIILYVPSSTEFSLTYSGSAEGRDGQVTLTIFKLRRN